MNSVVSHRHDILFLFDVVNGNPNGDPDAGNMPRIEPNTNKGIVSDVCLKRKIRNYLDLLSLQRENKNENGYSLFVKQGAILNDEIYKGIQAAEENLEKKVSKLQKSEFAMKWLCREFYDIRAFGAVLSTGNEIMKGSAYGQVRGPIQFSFAQSYHPITPLEITVTRCAVTKEEDKEKERTMGHKHIVPYALYAAKIYISPPFAERTGFTENDLEIFFNALAQMFEHDRSSARGEMTVRGIYDFEHVGSQHENNKEQNKREARLGCYHAHKLFDGIQVVSNKTKEEIPESFSDYQIQCRWNEEPLPLGVVLNIRHENLLPKVGRKI